MINKHKFRINGIKIEINDISLNQCVLSSLIDTERIEIFQKQLRRNVPKKVRNHCCKAFAQLLLFVKNLPSFNTIENENLKASL